MAAPSAAETHLAMLAYPEGRFYEEEFPEVESIVVVQVKRIVDMGAYVSLLEYDGKEGMMLLSELSKRRIRSVSKLLRVGRTEICLVLRVDKDKGYIDLSKRRVTPEDATEKEDQFARGKTVHGIMRHVANINQVEVLTLCERVAWPIYKKYGGDAYEAFRRHIADEIDVWEDLDFGEELADKVDKLKADIENDLRRKLVQHMMRIRAKIEVSCSEYEGIEAVKQALTAGLEVGVRRQAKMEAAKGDKKDEGTVNEDCDLKIKLIAHPVFVINCMCRDKKLGLEVVEEALGEVKKVIESFKGTFVLKDAAAVVGQNEPDVEGADEPSESGSSSGSSDSEVEGMGDLNDADLAALEAVEVEAEPDGAAPKP